MEYIWLSHVINSNTPLYGGEDKIKIESEKSIIKGDSCNTSFYKLTSHSGTHVDLPNHFISDGKVLDDYPPETWIFKNVLIIDVDVTPGKIINSEVLNDLKSNDTIELILFRTGFEKFRDDDIFWKNSPGLSAEISDALIKIFPNVRAVGIDFISITSFSNSEEGKLAHKSFLEKGILLFEDLSLKDIKERTLKKVIALPLRIEGREASPCTVIANI